MQYRRDNKTWLIWSCNFHLLSLWLYSFLLIIWKIFISKKILKILDLKKVLRFGGISSTLKTLVCSPYTKFILLKLETFLLFSSEVCLQFSNIDNSLEKIAWICWIPVSDLSRSTFSKKISDWTKKI